MFVNKIMHNRKRIEYTIAKFEEEQKAKLASTFASDANKTANVAKTPSTDYEQPAVSPILQD